MTTPSISVTTKISPKRNAYFANGGWERIIEITHDVYGEAVFLDDAAMFLTVVTWPVEEYVYLVTDRRDVFVVSPSKGEASAELITHYTARGYTDSRCDLFTPLS